MLAGAFKNSCHIKAMGKMANDNMRTVAGEWRDEESVSRRTDL